ncbi:hypothetical protein ACFX2I_022448 [Malus domestica]|uniref:Peptidase S54 rhomboid domain-containing protein n=1 Tax=Malus domestica TaxID=3750 RepID=A0A498HIR6_MALDO|nr:hypothetical protein DVH24_018743 [Malus domestica]
MTKMYPNSANANIVPSYEPRRLNNSGFDDETTTVLNIVEKVCAAQLQWVHSVQPQEPLLVQQRNSRCFYSAVKMFEVTNVVSIIVALAAASINEAPAVGASGAVFGLVGSLAVFVMRHRGIDNWGHERLLWLNSPQTNNGLHHSSVYHVSVTLVQQVPGK